MTDGMDEEGSAEASEYELPVLAGGAEELFGDYSVLSPGVEIVLDGRPLSAPSQK